MTRLDHILWLIAEECAEVAHRASKCARFGLDEVQPGQHLDNQARLQMEFNDLRAAMLMLNLETGASEAMTVADMHQIDEKVAKVEKFLRYSKEVGRLE